MNIATTSDVSATQNTQTNQTSNNSQKTSEKSFEEEVKSASKSEEKNDVAQKEEKNSEKTSPKTPEKSEEKTVKNDFVPKEMLEVNFTDFKYHNESQTILTQNIQNLLNTRELMTNLNESIDYDSINMSENDAKFFINLKNNISMKEIISELNDNPKNVSQNIQVSSVLMEKLTESLKTNKPFRIDFDKDISVIIKVNKDGKLSANFIPGDKAVEQYLRNNIASLRQRFDDENLPYSELSYNNSRERRQQRKKENDNE